LQVFDHYLFRCGFFSLQRQQNESDYSTKIRKAMSYFVLVFHSINVLRGFVYIFVSGNKLDKLLIGDFASLVNPYASFQVGINLGFINNVLTWFLINVSPKSHLKWLINLIHFMRLKLCHQEIFINENSHNESNIRLPSGHVYDHLQFIHIFSYLLLLYSKISPIQSRIYSIHLA